MSDQVAHDDAIGMPFADRNFVYGQSLWMRASSTFQLRGHILLVQFFDGVPVQVQLAGNVRHGAAATSPAYVPGKAFGIEGGFCQKVEPFSFHFSTMTAKYSSNLDLQIDACVATRVISNSSKPFVIPPE
ncbi:MAG: hypothetical protein WAT12_15665 [Candidatus Nitrotoga sp.]